MGLMLYRWRQRKVRDAGRSMKELVEVLEGIRVGALWAACGTPQLVVEAMTREPARLFSRPKLGDLIPQYIQSPEMRGPSAAFFVVTIKYLSESRPVNRGWPIKVSPRRLGLLGTPGSHPLGFGSVGVAGPLAGPLEAASHSL